MQSPARLLTIVAAAALLFSCGRNGSTVIVGSKNFTESVLLAELVAQQIEAHTSLPVDRRLNLGGTFICHQALQSGQIDIYPEYTGTALIAILKEPAARDPQQVFQTVSNAYREKFAAEWLAPFGFNNNYALVVREDDASQLQLNTISDLKKVAERFQIGFMFEFSERQDGYRGLIETYGLQFARQPKTMDLGLLYRALQDRQIDLAVGSGTDGMISAMKLRVLEDDKHYFPPYDAAAVVRTAALEAHPDLREALTALGGKFNAEEMRRLNYAVDGEQRAVADVIREIRQQKGL